ncbi:Fur-regulated basic protein FbpA [Cytobacillus oceanisediminis]|uniref:Fur-regulated basic protein FbpA n=1 Tax=Cytobacillus TaxID=2675230 RepID=UPI00203D413B|nr:MULTISPECIES: Fur-regulated basic protein FbpA [Cytobacillus]MBY0157994.1 Fur-regulated basic protein FbpA [Cytobacillus firmus]MCM3395333.1 Fur-regulated basic protein FbpA [Cytobacillus oceanisediminis]MCM3529488.1 Fur-regulated basic protein FbpA [Cytobacillus oceanisediminis]UQX53041.1 Fur-regulated basic protein FbpA [Cytobacillus pseudoceanisediminis]
MSKHLRKAVEGRKRYLINSLISAGVFKKGEHQLFALTLTDLEREYANNLANQGEKE